MCDEALQTLRRYLPCNPEIAAAIASITLQLQFLISKAENIQSNTAAFTHLLAELDTVAANVALSYRSRSPVPCNDCGDPVHALPCPFLFEPK